MTMRLSALEANYSRIVVDVLDAEAALEKLSLCELLLAL